MWVFFTDLRGRCSGQARHVPSLHPGPQALQAALAENQTSTINQLPFASTESYSIVPYTYTFQAPLTTSIDVSACTNVTQVDTAVSVWDALTLEPLATSDGECGEILGLPVAAQGVYYVVVASQRFVPVLRSDSLDFPLTVSISPGAPGAGAALHNLTVTLP